MIEVVIWFNPEYNRAESMYVSGDTTDEQIKELVYREYGYDWFTYDIW